MERVIESGEERDTEPEDSELLEELRRYSSRRLLGDRLEAGGSEAKAGGNVKRRLRALGYKG